MSPLGRGHLLPQGLHMNESVSPSPKDASCQLSMHSGQWFRRRRFLKVFCDINLYKTMSPLGVAVCDPREVI